MYITIDREQKAIVHKHRDRSVLANLSWIELTNAGITLPLGNPQHMMKEFSSAELKDIYENATGAKLTGYGPGLANAVHQMALRLPESVVNADEVAAQRLLVLDGDKSGFSYQAGHKAPLSHPGTFTPDPLKCARDPAEEARANAVASGYVPPAPGATSNPAGVFNPVPTTPRAPSAPRSGGSRDTIFRVADEIWAAAGSPRELPTILQLRKQMMTVLESDYNIKKTTSSNTLGDWQKARLS